MQVRGYNSNRRKRGNTAKPANKNSKILKIMLIALGVLLAGLAAVLIPIIIQLKSDTPASLIKVIEKDADNNINGLLNEGGNQAGAPAADTITYNGKTYVKNKNIVNIVFLGIDSDNEREKQNMGYRSDMMMLCAVDISNKTASLVSVPRDTWTDVYKVKDGKITETVKQRLNAAYTYGGGPNKWGASNAKACIQNFLERKVELDTPLDFTLDIPIPFFVSIDMDGIAKITEAIGGIEVTLDTTIPGVGKKGQTLNLKGQKAEDYLRNRHDTAGSDFGRTAHQREFMILLAKKIKSMGAVDAVTKLWDEFLSFGKTDLSLDAALDFAKILNNVNIDEIQMLAVPGDNYGVNGASVIKHDEAATLELLLSLYYTEVQ